MTRLKYRGVNEFPLELMFTTSASVCVSTTHSVTLISSVEISPTVYDPTEKPKAMSCGQTETEPLDVFRDILTPSPQESKSE